MAQQNPQKGNMFWKLQDDVDKILDDVGYLFDDMAEYTQENDPTNTLDIDKVLEWESPKTPRSVNPLPRQKVSSSHSSAPVYRTAHVPYTRGIRGNKNPSLQPKKIIRAMPRELQEEAKVYEYILQKKQDKKLRNATQFFFRRVD